MKAYFLFLVAVVTVATQAQQFTAAPGSVPVPPETSYIVCGTGFAKSECQFATNFVRLTLKDLKVNIPGWRWVVVPASQWKQTALSFGVKPSVPAFSSLSIGVTYVTSDLMVPTQRVDENLLAYTTRTGVDRLRWVMAHELGHILCNTADDTKAEAAGKRIQAGNAVICP